MFDIKKKCLTCQKDFWIIKPEQEFLQKMGLPFPNECPNCRQERRFKERGERRLFRTTCQNCGKPIITACDPQKETRKIFCKKCYLEWFEKNPVILK